MHAHGKMTGRLQDLKKCKLSAEQVLTALNDDAGLQQVAKDTGLSEKEIGDQVAQFVRVVNGAWSTVHVPRVDAVTGLMCW